MRFDREAMRKRLLDAILLLGAAACLGAFGYRAFHSGRISAIHAPLATFLSGKADRKASGQSAFVAAREGDELFDLDVLWVSAGSSATLLMDDQYRVELSEKTLLVLKKPFKGTGRPRDRIVALSGKVVVNDAGKDEVIQKPKDASDPSTEEKAKLLAPDQSLSRYAPSLSVLIFSRRKGQGEVTFEWPTPVKGYLSISDGTAEGNVHRPLKDSVSERVVLPTERRYQWNLMSVEGHRLAGPFGFDLRDYDEALVREAILKGGDSAKIQVLMDR